MLCLSTPHVILSSIARFERSQVVSKTDGGMQAKNLFVEVKSLERVHDLMKDMDVLIEMSQMLGCDKEVTFLCTVFAEPGRFKIRSCDIKILEQWKDKKHRLEGLDVQVSL